MHKSYLIFLFPLVIACNSGKPEIQPGWPAITRENKPWSRWWWMGNAVDTTSLRLAMEAYNKGGLGGLEITPVYGVRGYEERFVKFLSPGWIKHVEFALREGRRLDMGIDLAMASGWPFGGPWVRHEDACKTMKVKTYMLKEGEMIREVIGYIQEPLLSSITRKTLSIQDLKYPVSENSDSLQAWALEQVRYPEELSLKSLMACSDKGDILVLTGKINVFGSLDWKAPAGNWKLYAIFEGWHGKLVERAGPGGEGDVIDHFSAQAVGRYLSHFSEKLGSVDLTGLRAYFNDSYEVDDAFGEADLTPLLFDEFSERRGYDLQHYLPALLGGDITDINRRVLVDYRETMSDLLLEQFTLPWHNWAENSGKITRNQAHGSPANILDLYAASDIPETEGRDQIKIRSASSAAHITGKKLVSAEAATWLNEHFQASLADVKQHVDEFLLGGVNHIIYHGTAFSPQDAPWPGWMFYASVNLGPANTFWNDFGTLNRYVSRIQSFLQDAKPDNDILLYYPIFDEYAERGQSLLRHFDGSAAGTSVRRTAEFLIKNGFAFDFISDKQLDDLEIHAGKIGTGGACWQTILLPPLNYMPVSSLERIINLARDGAVVLMQQLPGDVPGLGQLAERRNEFQQLLSGLNFEPIGVSGIKRAVTGKGMILLSTDVNLLLKQAEIRRESLCDRNIQFVRNIQGNTTVYFLVNRGDQALDDMFPLQTPLGSAVMYNPMTGEFGEAIAKVTGECSWVYLQLQPGESCLVQVYPEEVKTGGYVYYKSLSPPDTINTSWELRFISGGPLLPDPVHVGTTGSWTELSGEVTRSFSGTAVYKTTLSLPDHADHWRLNLGRVAHSARVRLNGKEIATCISPPFTVILSGSDLRDNNVLEIRVTNLMGNRIAGMDRKKQPYRIFYNINFPARDVENRGDDGLFNASEWPPQESGLIGPVTVQPLKIIKGWSE
ncbi:MAG TPA: glycosyl hydrolase [Bacteroidales bacterium]|nr:glycosyl hydrolase [Bacteroidales bacterium]